MPINVLELVCLAVNFNPAIVSQLVCGDFNPLLVRPCASVSLTGMWFLGCGLTVLSLHLGSCSCRHGDRMERPGRDKKNNVWTRDGGCALTRLRPPPVTPELAHIVGQKYNFV